MMMTEKTFIIKDWTFMNFKNDPNGVWIKFEVVGDISPYGAKGVIMEKLRGIEGKYYTKKRMPF